VIEVEICSTSLAAHWLVYYPACTLRRTALDER